MRHHLLVLIASLLSFGQVSAQTTEVASETVIEKPITWTFEGTEFTGRVIYDASIKEPVPGILFVPNWMGPL